jgi:peptidoglycan hydrolase CwlO-like protein
MLRAPVVLCLLAATPVTAVVRGSSASVAHGGAAADDELSANPIRRVVSLLQGMAKKVAAEGEKEKELYEKFGCYCKNGAADLQESISSSTAKVPQVQSDIEESENKVKQLKQDLKSHQEDRSAAKAAMASATAQREEEHKKFLSVSGEYKSYISALSGAIPAIEKGMAGGFLQTKTGAVLRQAALNDANLAEYDRQSVMSFLSGTAASSDEYIPKSGEIVGILKTLKDDFDKSLADVTSEEEGAVKLYEELITAKTKQVNAMTASIEKKTTRVGELQVEIVNMKNDLTETEAALVADQKFAADLGKNCGAKAAEYEERQKTRAEEMVAIHETIKILNDDDALDLFKKTLPSASLIQMSAGKTVQQRALRLVRKLQQTAPKRSRPQLDFLALALQSKKFDFSKVVKMIDDMLALLKTEQVDDDSKKEYCEKQIDAGEDKVKVLAKKIDDLGTEIEDKEEEMKTLTSEIKDLVDGLRKLDKSVMEATEQRKEEHEEYVEVMQSDNAAKELLGLAKNRMNKFYNPDLYKPPPKRELSEEERIYSNMGGEVEFVQINQHIQHAAHKDDPGAAPATWSGGYGKKGEETTGVIAMLDLLVRDLDKEMTEADTEEKNAQKEYEDAMDDAAKKRATDVKAMAAKEKAKADAEETKTADEAQKKVETKEMMATDQYVGDLHGECDWLLQNFEIRKQARADEVSNLQDAKAILAGADFSFAQKAPRNLRGQ